MVDLEHMYHHVALNDTFFLNIIEQISLAALASHFTAVLSSNNNHLAIVILSLTAFGNRQWWKEYKTLDLSKHAVVIMHLS